MIKLEDEKNVIISSIEKIIMSSIKSIFELKRDIQEYRRLRQQLKETIENHQEEIKTFGGISKVRIQAVKNYITN